MANNMLRPAPFFNILNQVLLAFLAIVCAFPIVHVLALSFSTSTAAASGRVTSGRSSSPFVLPVCHGYAAFGRAFGVSCSVCCWACRSTCCSPSSWPIPWPRNAASFAPHVFRLVFPGDGPVFRRVDPLVHGDSPDRPDRFHLGPDPARRRAHLQCDPDDQFFPQHPARAGRGGLHGRSRPWEGVVAHLYAAVGSVIATVSLFVIVGHWNAWFDGLILMNNPSRYPLQSYLQTIIINPVPRC